MSENPQTVKKQPWSTKKKTLATVLAVVLAAGAITGGIALSQHVAFTNARDGYAAKLDLAAKADKSNAAAVTATADSIDSASELLLLIADIEKDGTGLFGADELKQLMSQRDLLEAATVEKSPEAMVTGYKKLDTEFSSTDDYLTATKTLGTVIKAVDTRTAEISEVGTSLDDAISATFAELQSAAATVNKSSEAVLANNPKASKETREAFTAAAAAVEEVKTETGKSLTTPITAYLEAAKNLQASQKKVVEEEAAAAAAEAAAAAAAQPVYEEPYYDPGPYTDNGGGGGGGGGGSNSGGGGGFKDYGSGGGGGGGSSTGSCQYNPTYGLYMGSGC